MPAEENIIASQFSNLVCPQLVELLAKKVRHLFNLEVVISFFDNEQEINFNDYDVVLGTKICH